eukprot:TRINITY_DN35999_c1_g1_i1.p1 TRINITY_DN35999_c1_g1~~TRINITY_DN35999_c1_g1_i1.p1  ORF type:complete len:344 (-),score=70.53 TRINITY_DN35999_c1_g1_i1:294-1325(-)
MSRQAPLPPRHPFQNRGASPPFADSGSLTAYRNDETRRGRHFRSPSQGLILEEQPSWLNELLSDTETNEKGIFHQRSASDLVVPTVLPDLTSLIHEENQISNESCYGGGKGGSLSAGTVQFVDPVMRQGIKIGNSSGVEAACIYGPNSPRRKSNLTQMDCSIVSALSEYIPQKSQYFSGNLLFGAEIGQYDTKGDASASDFDPEKKSTKRHSGQRSRVRKLQYIAELERTVNVFQTFESELAGRVASLLRQRHVLSIENSTLKKQITNLQAEKMIKDAQYQSMKKEIERLKMVSMKLPTSLGSSYFHVDPTEPGPSEPSWQMLDMGKLSLGGNPVPLKHGFKS